jgi:hypothetical protein
MQPLWSAERSLNSADPAAQDTATAHDPGGRARHRLHSTRAARGLARFRRRGSSGSRRAGIGAYLRWPKALGGEGWQKPRMAWLIRIALLAGGALAALLVARDAPNFPVLEAMMALLVIAAALVALALLRKR